MAAVENVMTKDAVCAQEDTPYKELVERRCCIALAQGVLKLRPRPGSDRRGQLIERDGHPPVRRLLDSQLVVPAPNVPHERVPGDYDPGTAVLPEPAHRPQPRLQPAMVGLDPVVGVPVGAMPGRR